MKRFLALFLTLIMLVSMIASCTPKQQDEQTTPPGGDVVTPTDKMAADIVATLNPSKQFEATFDCQEAIFTDVASKDAILGAFTAEGYTAVEATMVEGAKFETILLTKANELVTVYWMAEQKEVRVVWEKTSPEALSVLKKNATTDNGILTMVQIGVARGQSIDNPSVGMCYVFKLSNGNAMIIDGGYNYDECATNIYNTLTKLDIAKSADGKFIIEAWIFTYRQRDHVGVLENFAKLYGDKTEVNYFLYQMPTNKDISAVGIGVSSEENFHKLCQASYPNATYINPHTGLNYYFGNATVSMLYTPDVVWAIGRKMLYYNDNSLIFNVHGGGTGFLCMGGASENAAKSSLSLFEEKAYESGIFQLTNHGMGTQLSGSAWENIKKIYEATGATNAVLPMGTRTGEDLKNGNGRWNIIFQNAYNDQQMSFVVKKGDAPTSNGYFGHELFCSFIADVETGSNLAGNLGFHNVKSLHGYNGINVIDNDDGLVTYIASADKADMATVFQLAKGKITVKKNEQLSEWLKLPEFNATDVIGKIDANATVFESTFGVQEVVLKNVTDKAGIVEKFTAHGFAAVSVTPVEGAKFETLLFTNDAELVTIYWKPAENEARILFEKLDENILPYFIPNETTGTGELTVVQIGIERVNEADNPMIGMCYIIKLSNGNAIIIDGGSNNERCAENIYNTLSKLNVNKNANGQYVIEAWIFTHGHSDHNGVLYAFAQAYSEKADVLNFLYQLPSNGHISAVGAGVAGEESFVSLVKETYPNANYINPHTGLNYYFGNATISMLYTPDVLWSLEKKISYYNDTSLMFNVHGGNTGFLCFGDAGELAATTSWNLFEEQTYKSGLFQITHHGLTTQDGAYGNDWEYIKKIYESTGAKLVVLPLGANDPRSDRNGRYVVIFQYGHSDFQMSFVVNKDNAPFASKYFNSEVFSAFVEDVETGSDLLSQWGLSSYKTLYGYNGINMIDNGKGITTYISSRDKTPMATVFSFANGEVTVISNDELYDWVATPTQTETLYESTFDSSEEVYVNVKSKDIFVDKFVAEGYTLLDVDNVEGARYETILLRKENELVVLYWFPLDEEIRVIYETVDPDSLAPLTPNAETGKGEVTLIQMGVERDHRDPNIATDKGNPQIGMCYIMKLSNGRAVIIDGGFNYDTNADNLYNALVKLDIAKDANGKFLIEAWIFSHGHGDHNGIMTSFGKKYGDKTDVSYILYQLPTNQELADVGAGVAGEAAFHELCKTTYPNATYILPHANLKYYFGNAAIDVLYTPDLIWSPSNRLPDYNDTSIVTRWQAGGTAFLSFGDAGEIPATAMWKYYGVSSFDSGILQIAHHGLTTGANESQVWKNMKKIYEGAGVDYVFLPMGAAYGARNGRWSVICAWGYPGGQVSFSLNRKDNAAGVNQESYAKFINGILDGTGTHKTLLGYNGINMIDNGEGRITYIASNENSPMVTVLTFANGGVTVDLNTELYTWLEG